MIKYLYIILFILCCSYTPSYVVKCIIADIDKELKVSISSDDSEFVSKDYFKVQSGSIFRIVLSINKKDADEVLKNLPASEKVIRNFLPCFILDYCCSQEFDIISGREHDRCEFYDLTDSAQRTWILKAKKPGRHYLVFNLVFQDQNNKIQANICKEKWVVIEVSRSYDWILMAISDNWYRVATLLVAFSSAFVAFPTFLKNINSTSVWWKILIFVILFVVLIPIFSLILN